jgi:hypothetical protein
VGDELAVTRAETQRLIDTARQVSVMLSPIVPNAADTPTVDEAPTEIDPHILAMEVLRMMRELLNGFPAEWQVRIVKAITTRTMLVVAEQLHRKPLALTA